MTATCMGFLKGIRSQLLLVCTLFGAIVGIGLGLGLRELHPSKDVVLWIGIPGELFLRMLMAIVVPLVIGSIISGAASLDPRSSGKLGGLAVGYNVISNLFGSVVGVAVFFIFGLGNEQNSILTSSYTQKTVKLSTHDMFADLLRNVFPGNIVTAAFEKTQTKYRLEETVDFDGNSTSVKTYSRYISSSQGTNILGLIVVSMAMGLAAGRQGVKAKPFIRVFEALTDISMTILQWICWLTPVGVASLIAHALVVVENLNKTFSSVGVFIGALSVGILFHQLAVVPIMYTIFFRKLPFRYLLTSLRPIIIATAPPSSAVAIPVACHIVETKHGVDERVSRFFIPLGAATNRTGSCMFICMSVMFFAILEGRPLEPSHILVLIILTALSALGVPSIASGSIVAIIIISTQLNITTQFVGLLMAVEWFTDRVRSSSNMSMILLGSLVINKVCEKLLRDLDAVNKTEADDATNQRRTTEEHIEKQPALKEETDTLIQSGSKECTYKLFNDLQNQ